MILFEIVGSESHPAYQELEVSNGNRQYDFLRSVVAASLTLQRSFLSETIVKALNHQAITCLHAYAGEYRPCPVKVGNYTPPEHYRVPALMEDFVNALNRLWEQTDAVVLTAFVLWRLNHIHPFINGNGRTARAASYFVLCVKSGGWLAGATILPELLRQNHQAYVAALQLVDQSVPTGNLDLAPLHALLTQLISQQLQSAPPLAAAQPPAPPPQAAQQPQQPQAAP